MRLWIVSAGVLAAGLVAVAFVIKLVAAAASIFGGANVFMTLYLGAIMVVSLCILRYSGAAAGIEAWAIRKLDEMVKAHNDRFRK